ncbi:MAG TPA: type I-U CRISPR-associated protein Csb2 [Nannocystaceae bacterium]|nr:type I-U CRISPR-associated protein Csb2 [Nannocystaceae bacterium]
MAEFHLAASTPAARARWLILRHAAGPPLSIAHAPALTRALRGALMRHGDQPPAELLSGHRPDGRPSEGSHAAFVALPGDALGTRERAIAAVAVVLPPGVPEVEAAAIADAVDAWQRADPLPDPRALGWGDRAPAGALFLPGGGEWWAERADPPCFVDPPPALVGPGRRWSTALPIALDRFPGHLEAEDPARAADAARRARELVIAACRRAGLPAPVDVWIAPRADLPGIPDAAVFAALALRAGRPPQVLVHARLEFDVPIAGPLLLGRGRFFGLGLLVSLGDPVRPRSALRAP